MLNKVRERERERFGNGTRKTETQNTYKEVVYVHREINDKRGESKEHSPVGLDTVRLTFAIQNGNVISSQASLGLDGHQEWRTSARGNALAREMLRLDGNGEGSLLKLGIVNRVFLK